MRSWNEEIGAAHLVKKHLHSIDIESVWEFHMPSVAATEAEVCLVESELGRNLDNQYREFLRHANGWRCFLQAIDLFSLEDLQNGERHDKARTLLASLEPLEKVCGEATENVMPIAVSQDSIDLFIVVGDTGRNPGSVCWLAGQEVDRFDNFEEFFLAMVDYNREEIRAFG